MLWDHEPALTRSRRRPRPRNAETGWAVEDEDEWLRFRESLLSLLRMHWDHEPQPSPLPAFRLRQGYGGQIGHPLPRFGRGRGQVERGRSWKASFRFCACIGTMNPPLTPPRRGTDRTRTDACSPPGRGRGWVGSWKVPCFDRLSTSARGFGSLFEWASRRS